MISYCLRHLMSFKTTASDILPTRTFQKMYLHFNSLNKVLTHFFDACRACLVNTMLIFASTRRPAKQGTIAICQPHNATDSKRFWKHHWISNSWKQTDAILRVTVQRISSGGHWPIWGMEDQGIITSAASRTEASNTTPQHGMASS